ncbi:alpha/beta fold hydrolase [Sulfurospirillum arcachonense]|uniref:alpha/beta fold hydrolase n=1 Tax=Sulfurospirillum arcachonense TaxID=57666 RepID=UPI0004681E45|nr:alpha/beta hydrolase [Sulfurospirillum arcachonense]
MKTTIYLLPGSMCDERLWSKIIPLFDENYELIHVPIPLKNNFCEMAEELLAFFPDKPINLLGFSLGGYLAAYFSVKYPEKIDRLFLASSSAKAFSHEEIQKREAGLNYIHNNGFRGLGIDRIRILLDPINHENKELINILQEMYAKLGIVALTKQIEAIVKRETIITGLVNLHHPMTFCYSSDDVLIKKSWMNIMSKRKKNAIFIEFPGAAHMLPLEKPQEFALEIKKWVHTQI